MSIVLRLNDMNPSHECLERPERTEKAARGLALQRCLLLLSRRSPSSVAARKVESSIVERFMHF